jgi:hypothetical protein
MALSLQLGYPDIPKSITNPNVNTIDAMDVESPLSFLVFIKLITVSFQPDSLQDYYNYYLKSWNDKSTHKIIDEKTLIIERYRDFIKDISINYTTNEEKEFLSKIDYADPFDLDVVLGFYSKKLNELALFYNNKRDNVKYNVIRNKIKGTDFGTEKTLSELTISYLETLQGGKIIYDLESIKNDFEIEIEELYDTYPIYFNQKPNEKVYDKKDLDYGKDIFLKSNSELISDIFSGISDTLKSIKEVDQLFDNKRKLTEKYVSTDFYYLSTGSTVSSFVSGKLFDSTSNVLNFVNRNYPTTASTDQSEYLQSNRIRGFFKPSKVSIILVDGQNSSFSFNLSNLSPSSVYYFPDPNIIGENGEVLTFIVDDSFLKRNYSSGNAANQPKSTQFDTKYYGYVSKIEPSEQKYLDTIFDSGFVKDIKSDIYNNLFGLFNNDHRFKKTIKFIDSPITYNVVLNGYQFYDDLYWEGANFNYSTVDNTTFKQTIRTGLTGGNFGNFTNVEPDLTLFFGLFQPFNELINPTESNLVTSTTIVEGAYFSNSEGNRYPDLSSSDLSAYEFTTEGYYYTNLLEGGIRSNNPMKRALVDPLYPSLTAQLVEFTRTSAINMVDGGYFGVEYDFDIQNTINPVAFVPATNTPTVYTLSTTPYQDTYALSGKMMVRNTITKEVKPLVDSLTYISTKYSAGIVNQLQNNVQRFEVANDTLFIETLNYLTINKIVMDSNGFTDPRTSNYSLTHSIENYDKLSNRFKIKNDVYYCKLTTLSNSITSNNFVIYPEIYRFDLLSFKNTKIFPINSNQITEFFNISGGDIRYTSCDSPTLTYNSRNNIFTVSFLLKDQNNYPKFDTYDFYLNPDVVFVDHASNQFSNNRISNIFKNTSMINVFLSSGPLSTLSEELYI